jgi:hypothetical protein
MNKLWLPLLLLSILIAPAHASSIGAVGSPKVEAGKTSLELRFGYHEAEESSSQDERFRSRVHLDHGFNDFYALRVIASQDRRKNDNLEQDTLGFENRFYLLKAKEHGFGFGARAGYNHKDGDKKPSVLTFGLYGLVPLDDYELRVNQMFEHAVGEDREPGLSAELRVQATKEIVKKLRLGIESFHDFDNLNELSGYSAQAHTIGPVLKGRMFEGFGNMQYEAGYRAGISDAAPDHTVKFFLSTSF